MATKVFVLSVCSMLGLISQCNGQMDFSDPFMASLLFGGSNMFGGHSSITHGSASSSVDASASVNVGASSNVPDMKSTVAFIVGQEATPDDGLIQYAAQNGWPPRSEMDLINYIPHFQRIARATFAPHLAKIALETVKTAENQRNASLASQINPAEKANSVQSAVTEMKALTEELNNLVMQRSMDWANLHLKGGATPHTTPSSNGGFDALMPFAMMGGMI
ncbi:uncharacterized protein LOC127851235 [Dreissena polymorpha]|uniref:Uncharacterized protein n=1 Tax=Dreissena polymorpha TaxID=45954 RepID=A0A9D4CZP6_DREPO|nr:uncharacterized protein LOC127851235 [Dreissena polymorpha]KAH3735960.1 hypothetical protein DPMN_042521 [Dreissena polymorpha]